MELTNVEEKLIRKLAEKGPLTGYDLHTKKPTIMSNAHWERLKKTTGPEGLNLIFELEPEGASKPYWLTGPGIVQALRLEANPEHLEKYINEVYDSEKAEVLMILTSVAKDISPVLWDYIGRLQENMAKGESTTLTLLEMVAKTSRDMQNTITVLANHEKLGPLVAETMIMANKQLKEKMEAT